MAEGVICMTAVYIHIPFCERICTYCDFPKRIGTLKQMDAYLEALAQEVKGYLPIPPLRSLYIGGGTPSILSHAQLLKLKSIISMFQFETDYEFTIECNPEHITPELVCFYHTMGVNRISLGVQTFNSRLLKLLNRNHNRETVFQAVEWLRNGGFTNISIDLIFALPMQEVKDLQADLEYLMELNPEHVSYYSLILEEKTVLNKWVSEHKIELLENEVEAEMYELVLQKLNASGYHHYEISNFAKENKASVHNTTYWQNQHYYGLGMAASGYLAGIRYTNTHLLGDYIARIEQNKSVVEISEVLSRDTILKEAMMLGLRMISGVELSAFKKRYGVDCLSYFAKELDYLQKQGWIEIDTHVRLTHAGLFYGNEVFGAFL